MTGNVRNTEPSLETDKDQAAKEKPYRFGGGIMPIVVYAHSRAEAQVIYVDRIAGKS